MSLSLEVVQKLPFVLEGLQKFPVCWQNGEILQNLHIWRFHKKSIFVKDITKNLFLLKILQKIFFSLTILQKLFFSLAILQKLPFINIFLFLIGDIKTLFCWRFYKKKKIPFVVDIIKFSLWWFHKKTVSLIVLQKFPFSLVIL